MKRGKNNIRAIVFKIFAHYLCLAISSSPERFIVVGTISLFESSYTCIIYNVCFSNVNCRLLLKLL